MNITYPEMKDRLVMCVRCGTYIYNTPRIIDEKPFCEFCYNVLKNDNRIKICPHCNSNLFKDTYINHNHEESI